MTRPVIDLCPMCAFLLIIPSSNHLLIEENNGYRWFRFNWVKFHKFRGRAGQFSDECSYFELGLLNPGMSLPPADWEWGSIFMHHWSLSIRKPKHPSQMRLMPLGDDPAALSAPAPPKFARCPNTYSVTPKMARLRHASSFKSAGVGEGGDGKSSTDAFVHFCAVLLI